MPDGGVAGDNATEIDLSSLALTGRLPRSPVRQGVEPWTTYFAEPELPVSTTHVYSGGVTPKG